LKELTILLRASPEERAALAHALALVVEARLALWRRPFREAAAERPEKLSPVLARVRPRRLAWAVEAVSRRVPQASCLTRGLALRRLLARAGHASRLVVGVAGGAGRDFESHAWLECDGETLIGAAEGRYAPILTLPGAAGA
jgi:hypothetical protein